MRPIDLASKPAHMHVHEVVLWNGTYTSTPLGGAFHAHISHRPGAAPASGGFKQPNARAGLGRANRSPYACSASADNENVILVFHTHSLRTRRFSDDQVKAPIATAGNLVMPVQRKKALVSGSVFVNREEWIRSLRCASFVAVARTGSFSAAAQKLGEAP
jgi:hypothetical protein